MLFNAAWAERCGARRDVPLRLSRGIIWVESGHNEKNCHLTAGRWAWQAIRDVCYIYKVDEVS